MSVVARDESRRGATRAGGRPIDALDRIKRLYYGARRSTIERDLARAIDLLASIDSEEERERAAVYMDGLAQMRSDWAPASGGRNRS